jgi:hypothetical protein
MNQELHLTVLLFLQGESWVAQVLEHDIVAHGATEYAALATVQLAIQAHVNFDTRHQRQPFSLLPRAPQHCWDVARTAKPLEIPPRSQFPAIIDARVAEETVSVAC